MVIEAEHSHEKQNTCDKNRRRVEEDKSNESECNLKLERSLKKVFINGIG